MCTRIGNEGPVSNRFRIIACLAALQLATAAMAAETQRPAQGPAPDWVRPTMADLATPPATDAPLQVLLSDQQVRITTEAVETFVHTRMKVLTPQGMDALGTLRFNWKPDSDLLTLHRLAVLRDGQARDLLAAPDSLTILRREDQLEQSVLTGMLTAVAQPSGLRVGDTIEMSFTLRRRDPVVHDTPDVAFVLGNGPANNVRLRVLWPESLPLRWRASSYMPPGEPVKADGWMDLTYELKEAEPLLQPVGAPQRFTALRMLELTSFRDWQALSQRLAPLYAQASQLKADSPLRAEVERIRREHAAPADRAAAALRLVQDEIRYVLLAMNDGGLNPAAADETWERRFGDCKAKSALLLALLRELGIEAEVVAVSTSFPDGLDARLPGVSLFDHVLVRARIGGHGYWLDGTRSGDRSLARLQPPPFRWALPLTARGSELVPIPLEPLREPQLVNTLEVDAREGVRVPAPFKAEMKMTGDPALILKRNLDSLPAANREEALLAFWRRQYRGLTVEETSSHFDEQQGVLTWTATGTMEMEWDPEYATYEPHSMGLGYRADFSRPRGTDTSAPYAVDFPDYTRAVEIIRLPPQRTPFTVTGTDIDRTIAGAEFRRKASVKDGVFTAERTYRTIAPEFPASQRAEAERVLLEMSRNTLFLKLPEHYQSTKKDLVAEAEYEFGNADDYYSLGFDMVRSRLFDEALVALSKAIEIDPDHVLARIARANLLGLRGDYDGALVDRKAVLALDPDNIEKQEALVNLYGSRQEYPEALAIVDKMVAKSPTVERLMQRASLHRTMGNLDLALQDVDAALAADPERQETQVSKATLLADMGRKDEVPALAAAVRQAAGSQIDGLRAAAGVFMAVDLMDLARQQFDEELRISPSATGYLLRSYTQKDKEAILADLRQVMRATGDNAGEEEQATRMMLQREWYREAVDMLVARERDIGLGYKTRALLGVARWKVGDQKAARADFAAARDAAPEESRFNDMCWDKASYDVALEEALGECEAALADNPACGACYDSLGLVLLRLGRFEDSIQAYDRALDALPGHPYSLFGRGVARIRKGDREAGEKDLADARRTALLVEKNFARMGITP